MRTDTALIHGGARTAEHDPTAAPIYQTATFRQSTAVDFDEFDYTRTDNPTRSATPFQWVRSCFLSALSASARSIGLRSARMMFSISAATWISSSL